MHGHAWEWCQDWYGPYTDDSKTDPTGPSTGTRRVVRSGRFYVLADDVRSAARSPGRPDIRSDFMSARLVRMGPKINDVPSAITPETWGNIKAPVR